MNLISSESSSSTKFPFPSCELDEDEEDDEFPEYPLELSSLDPGFLSGILLRSMAPEPDEEAREEKPALGWKEG